MHIVTYSLMWGWQNVTNEKRKSIISLNKRNVIPSHWLNCEMWRNALFDIQLKLRLRCRYYTFRSMNQSSDEFVAQWKLCLKFPLRILRDILSKIEDKLMLQSKQFISIEIDAKNVIWDIYIHIQCIIYFENEINWDKSEKPYACECTMWKSKTYSHLNCFQLFIYLILAEGKLISITII